MNIQILHLIEGAQKALGMTVIIDVFRAFSVEAYIMDQGAEKIIPVSDIALAYQYKEAHPDIVLIGERHGKRCEGFDFGNSPSEVKGHDFTGKTIVHTTSAGTQGIVNAVHADTILTGCFANAKAVAQYIAECKPSDVSLVCMGLEGKEETQEDTLCAEYLRSLLLGAPIDLSKRLQALKYTSGAKFFDPEQQSVFPEEDFHLCLKPNIFPFVLRLDKDKSGAAFLKRVDTKSW